MYEDVFILLSNKMLIGIGITYVKCDYLFSFLHLLYRLRNTHTHTEREKENKTIIGYEQRKYPSKIFADINKLVLKDKQNFVSVSNLFSFFCIALFSVCFAFDLKRWEIKIIEKQFYMFTLKICGFNWKSCDRWNCNGNVS